jgi:predicted dehydrogenase
MIHCRRLAPFSGRSLDIGVVLDLMIHDIDLVLTLVPAPVREVEAVGVSVLGGHEDLAQAWLRFANGCIAHLSASRLNSSPVRRLDVWSSEGHAAADLHTYGACSRGSACRTPRRSPRCERTSSVPICNVENSIAPETAPIS